MNDFLGNQQWHYISQKRPHKSGNVLTFDNALLKIISDSVVIILSTYHMHYAASSCPMHLIHLANKSVFDQHYTLSLVAVITLMNKNITAY